MSQPSLPFKCAACGEQLKVPGGILFSPPDQDNMVRKDHLCGICYDIFEDKIIGRAARDAGATKHKKKDKKC